MKKIIYALMMIGLLTQSGAMTAQQVRFQAFKESAARALQSARAGTSRALQGDTAAMSWFRQGVSGGLAKLQHAKQQAGRFWNDWVAVQLRNGLVTTSQLLNDLKLHATCVAQGTCTAGQKKRIGLALIGVGTALTMLAIAGKNLRAEQSLDPLAKIGPLTEAETFLQNVWENNTHKADAIMGFILAAEKEDEKILNQAKTIIGQTKNYRSGALYLELIEQRKKNNFVSPIEVMEGMSRAIIGLGTGVQQYIHYYLNSSFLF